MTSEKALSMMAALSVTLGGLAIAYPAFAQNKTVVVTATKDDLPTRRVSYRDLNLASPAGEKVLLHRVRYAVRDVCLESTGPGAQFYEELGCRREAWNGARPQIQTALQRAREIAQFGSSAIPAVAISISFAER